MPMGIFSRFRSSHVPRFRSADRDRETDRERLERVREAVAGAIAAIDSEGNGVASRLNEASSRAAHIAGNDAEAYLQRDVAEEQMLSEAERQMIRATERLRELRDNKLFLKRILDDLSKGLDWQPLGVTPVSQ